VSDLPLGSIMSPDSAGSSVHCIDSMLLSLCRILSNIAGFHPSPPVDGFADIVKELLSRWQGLDHVEVRCHTPVSTSFGVAGISYRSTVTIGLTTVNISTADAAFMADLLNHLGRTMT
jgi:hypothetical protein